MLIDSNDVSLSLSLSGVRTMLLSAVLTAAHLKAVGQNQLIAFTAWSKVGQLGI